MRRNPTSGAPMTPRGSFLAVCTLWRREMVRFLRQPSRIASAAGSPLLFWLFIGSGFSRSFRMPGAAGEMDYRQYFFPGTVALLVLFAAIFSTISVIEDRHGGFLQGVLVSPVPRASMVAGKVLGGASLAWLQGLAFVALAPAAGIRLDVATIAATAGVLALLALGLTAVGFAFSWKVDSTQGFHGVMNLLLIPMWLLSGALFPAAGAAPWLAALMRFNPMTYGVAALQHALHQVPAAGSSVAGMPTSLVVMAAFCALAFAADLAVVRR
jgi:daunorubicin resistance ABC transporter membrane protein